MKRRIYAMVLSLALILSLIPGQSFAREKATWETKDAILSLETGETQLPVTDYTGDFDEDLTDGHEHFLTGENEEAVTFSTVLTAADLVSQYGKVTLKEGAYVLGEDLSMGNVGMLSVEGKVTLCLAGHDLDLGGNYIMFGGNGSTLQICDCAKEEKGQILTTSSTGAVLVNGNHTLELYGVSVKGTAYGINSQGGTVKIYDSTISVENMGERNSAYAILVSGGSAVVENSVLTAQAGSAAFAVNSMNKNVLDLKNSTLKGTAGSNAFGVLTSNGSVATMENCDLIGESTDVAGTAMGANSCGDLTAKNCRFTACGVGNNIFGIYSYGDVTASLTDCTVTADSQNTGNATAMGANNGSGIMTLKNCTVLSKGAEGRFSFGAYSVGKLTIEDCSVTATGSGENVYGLYNCGSAELAGDITLDGTVADIALGTDGSVNAPVSQTVTLIAPLTGKDTFSVYTYAEPTATAPQLIVKGWEEFGTEINPFYPVNADYSICDMDGDLYLTDFHVHSLHTGSEETVIFTKVLTSADMVPQYGKVTLTDGAYVLGEDISLANVAGLNIEGSVTLCLAGHDLDMGANYIGFSGSNRSLRICDCAVEDKGEIRSNSGSGVVLIYGNHTLELYETLLSGSSYAVNNQGGQVKVYGATLSAANPADRGYAYALLASGGTVTLEGSTLIGEAETVYTLNVMNSCVVSMKDSTIIAKAKNAYAVLLSDGVEATAVGCNLRSEGAVDGGTVFALNGSGNLTAEDTTFVAQGNGSSIFGINTFSGSTVSLTDCTVTADSQNTGTTTAMGINNSGKSMTLKNTTVTSKGAEGRYSFGIYGSGTLSVEDCTVISEGTGEFVYGIYAANNVELQGEITVNGTTSDIALSNGKYIVLTGELTGGDTYSVYTYEEPTATAPQLIVKGWEEFGTEINPFYSAIDGFCVEEKETADGQKELYMVVSEYEITVEETVGGNLTANAEAALPGAEIRIDAAAEEEYLLQGLTVTYRTESAEEISLPITSHVENGTVYYTFLMPEGDVTVKGSFEQKALKFRSISLSLESNIAMNFYVADATLEGYSDVYILVEKELYDEVGNLQEERAVVALTDYVSNSGGGIPSHLYVYSELSAKEMNSKVYATIYVTVNGIVIAGETREYSVVQYATNMIRKIQVPAIKTLLVDLLNYGTLAQQVFNYNNKAENYANASEIVQAAQSYATQTVPELRSYATNDMGADYSLPVAIVGISLGLEDRVEMNYFVKATSAEDLEGLSLVITYLNSDGEPVKESVPSGQFLYDPQSGYYKINFHSLKATDMRTVVTARLENEEGTVMSNTRTYSIESYASSVLGYATASQVMKDLLVAMMKYGDSTEAYFSGT